MKIPPVMRPPTPDESRQYFERVQGTAPKIHEQMIDTSKKVFNAFTSSVATVATAPIAVAEAGTHLTANVLALPSTMLHPVGKGINWARTKIYNTLSTSA